MMIGLCHSCHTSNVELVFDRNSIVCKKCVKRADICDEYEEMEKNGTLGKEIDL